jgi:hypothetical protein
MKLSRNNLNITETYVLANKIILFLLLLVFLYPLLTAYFNFGFSCQHKIIFGTDCRSCFLTRGLRSCMKLNFSTANKLNTQSTFIYITVISQIIFRFLLIHISKVNNFLKHEKITAILSLDFFVIVTLLIFNLKYYG